MKKNETIIAAFATPADARAALHDLRSSRFTDRQVGILARGEDGGPELKSFKELETSKTGKGAAVGAATGAGVGVLWALGIAAGLLPAIGPVIAGGLLAAVLASGASAAAAGGIVGALVGLGLSGEDATYYEEQFRRGNAIVVVQPESVQQAVHAGQILANHGGYQRSRAA